MRAATTQLVIKTIGVGVTCISFAAIFFILWDQWDVVTGVIFTRGVVYLFTLASGIGVAALYIRAHVWRTLLPFDKQKDTIFKNGIAEAFSIVRLVRYIPGKIAGVGLKIWYGKKFGLNIQSATLFAAVDTLLPIVVSFAISLLALAVYSFLVGISSMYGLVFVIIAIILFTGTLLLVPSKLIHPIFKKKKIMYGIKRYEEKKVALLVPLICFFLARGISFVILVSIFTRLDVGTVLFSMLLFISAGFLGMIAPFTPAGLGVTEITLVSGLYSIFPLEIALVIAATSRIWDIIVDALYFMMVVAIRKISS